MPDEQHLPRRESMEGFLAALDEVHGGASTWLRKHGWTDEDADALKTALLG
jgi:hypothetical protein